MYELSIEKCRFAYSLPYNLSFGLEICLSDFIDIPIIREGRIGAILKPVQLEMLAIIGDNNDIESIEEHTDSYQQKQVAPSIAKIESGR